MGESKPVGRPSKYDIKICKKIYKLALAGLNNRQLADFFEINEDTFYDWLKVHPEFSEALKSAREEADADIIKSLYQRAKGYKHKDVHITSFEGDVIMTPITKQYPPDVNAAIFILTNRKGDKWKRRKESGDEEQAPKPEDNEINLKIKRAPDVD